MNFRRTRKNPLATAKDVEPNVAAAIEEQVPPAVNAAAPGAIADAAAALNPVPVAGPTPGKIAIEFGEGLTTDEFNPLPASWTEVVGRDAGTPSAGASLPLRRGTAAQWTSSNPILASGEEGFETNTGRKKKGDGVTPWAALTYGDRAAQRQTERTYRTRPSRVILPAGFGFDPGVPILTDGLSYWAKYDAATRKNTGGADIYWNSVTGDNSTGDGSEGAPYKTFAQCYNTASDGDTIIVQNSGIIWRNDGPGSTEITKSINLVAANPGDTTYVTADLLTWSATSGRPGVYEASRTNVRKVVDIELDADGLTYTKAASLDACEATPMSWYQASNGSGLLYVHNFDGSAPNPLTVLALLQAETLALTGFTRTAAQNFYMEGLRVLGSHRGIRLQGLTGGYKLTFTPKDCEFVHLGDYNVGTTDPANLYNGFGIVGNVDIVSQRTRIAYACLDGFNYHKDGSLIPTFVEIDCEAHDCGQEPNSIAAAVGPYQNASTAHDGTQGLRIGGKYRRTYGAIIADVHTDTKTVNLGNDAWGSLATVGSGFSQGFSAQQAGAEMWVYGGRSWGTYNDLYAAAGATMHVSNTEFVTKGGGGTFDITSPSDSPSIVASTP